MNRAKEIFETILRDGAKAIDNFILDRQSEELFLDFKRSGDNGNGRKLYDDDRKNYSKAISGFGNSEGGVIVWGIDCSKDTTGADIPQMKVPILDVHKFVSFLEGVTSGCTIPPHNLVLNRPIATNGSEGFVITHVPRSLNAPHQTLIKNQQNTFYIRAGSSFEQIPYQVLAGMFGRRPNPSLFLDIFGADRPSIKEERIEFSAYFMLKNIGLGIAHNLFYTVKCSSPGGPNSVLAKAIDATAWAKDYGGRGISNELSMITTNEYRLAPQATLKLFYITCSLKPPFPKQMIIEGIVGCENCPPIHFSFDSDGSNLENQYKNILWSVRDNQQFDHVREIAKLLNFKNMKS